VTDGAECGSVSIVKWRGSAHTFGPDATPSLGQRRGPSGI
jgi:hypothetical protein